jgi:hypothetical protein
MGSTTSGSASSGFGSVTVTPMRMSISTGSTVLASTGPTPVGPEGAF